MAHKVFFSANCRLTNKIMLVHCKKTRWLVVKTTLQNILRTALNVIYIFALLFSGQQ